MAYFLFLLALLLGRTDGVSFKKLYKANLLNVKRNHVFSDKSSAASQGRRSGEEDYVSDDRRGPHRRENKDNDDEPRLYDVEENDHPTHTLDDNFDPTHNIDAYTKSLTAKVAVSTSSAVVSMLISSFLSMMLFSSVWGGLVKVSAVLFFATGLVESDIGDLSRSLGMFLLLLLKKSKLFVHYGGELLNLLAASISIKGRRPFPPVTTSGGSNPWKYQRASSSAPDFDMPRTLTALLLLGAYMGSVISCFLPLVPTWVDELVTGGVLLYVGTLQTPLGDLARYTGFGVISFLRHMRAVADQVHLYSNAKVVVDRISSFASKVNKEYRVSISIQQWAALLYSQVMGAVSRIAAEMSSDGISTHANDDSFAQ